MTTSTVRVHQSVRLYLRDVPVLEKLYQSRSRGMQEAVDGFLPLRFHTLREIRGIFTKAELTALVDHMRHMPLDDPIIRINKEIFISYIVDSSEWKNLAVTHGIVYSDLVYKIEKLTAAQNFFLLSEIHRYWRNNKGMRLYIDDFINSLL